MIIFNPGSWLVSAGHLLCLSIRWFLNKSSIHYSRSSTGPNKPPVRLPFVSDCCVFCPAPTPGEEVPGSILVPAARSLLIGSVSVQRGRLRQRLWSFRSVSCVAALKIVRCSVLRPVPDKVYLLTRTLRNQPTKQTNNASMSRSLLSTFSTV